VDQAPADAFVPISSQEGTVAGDFVAGLGINREVVLPVSVDGRSHPGQDIVPALVLPATYIFRVDVEVVLDAEHLTASTTLFAGKTV